MVDNSSHVRQQCSKLKPILGSKVENIYAAYVAEDDKGKEQIGHYLNILMAKYMPVKLSQNETFLLPPPKEQAAGEYPIGKVQYVDKDLCEFALREDEWIQHMAILGRSGAGKTVLLKNMIGLLRPDSGTIDIDMSVDTYLLSSFCGVMTARLPPANDE